MSDKQKSNGKFPQKALMALRAVAKKPEAWREAMMDPIGFLAKSDIRLPEGASLQLYEAAFDPEKTSYHEDELTHRNKTPMPAMFDPSTVGSYVDWQCPAGTRPVRTPESVETCIKWGGYSSPPEWVPAAEGSRYGHFESNRMMICVQSITVTTWVTKCLPVFEIVQFEKPNKLPH